MGENDDLKFVQMFKKDEMKRLHFKCYVNVLSRNDKY